MQNKYIELFQESKLDKVRIDMSFPLDKEFVKKQLDNVLKFIG